VDKRVMDFAKTLNVLFVEDDANSREQMCKVLELYFDKVECAKDGEEGLNKFKKDKFVIFDFWNNFEYFNEKPSGEKPEEQISLYRKIF